MQEDSPETVFFSITNECLMRCKVCTMWALRDPSGSLSTSDRLAVVSQLKGFAGPVHVVVTGGEPFMKLGELLQIGHLLQSQGNTMGVVTSGFLLTPDVLDRLVDSGITNLSISLDFPKSAQHDAQRGRAGTFGRIAEAIAQLSVLRKKGRKVPVVGINCILMAQSLNYVEELALLASEWDVSEILFQPVQPDFAGDGSSSLSGFRNWLPSNPERVDSVLDAIESLRGRVPLGQTRQEFELIKRYFRNPMRLPPGSCQSARLNLMIDVSGNVTHCFGQARTGIGQLGRVPSDNIVDLWKSTRAAVERAFLSRCTFGCGSLLCHSRSSVPKLVNFS